MLSPIEEIKSRIDVAEFIQSYIRLQKAGVNFKAPCPFHSEKTPSFFVSPSRQIWHCFGCGKGGDIFKFVMEIEGHDFPEALRMLAQRAGVVLKREDPSIRSERNRLYDLCEEAAKVFERNLALTPVVKTYLKKRGVADATLQEFRIGFAPQSWDFLLKALIAKGFRKEEVERAGLAVKSEDRVSWYDRFRSRIIFPVSDANERVIGFGGRIFELAESKKPEVTEAKYINTPQTLIYDKSRALYGFEKAKHEVRQKNQVVVVEGYMDCIMSYQAGVKNTIAVSGTALTSQQLTVLRRLCDAIVCSFDADAAGDSATRRSLDLAAQFDFERRIAQIPSGKDPADTVQENPELWQEAVLHAKPIINFYFEKSLREHNPRSVEGKKKIGALLLPLLAGVANEIEKAHWIRELSRSLETPEVALWNELQKRKGRGIMYNKEEMPKEGVLRDRREALEERFLALLAVAGEELRACIEENRWLSFRSAAHGAIFQHLLKPQVAAALTPTLQSNLDILHFKGEVSAQMSRDLGEELLICGRELEKECIREKLRGLGDEVSRNEREGGSAVVTTLLEDFRTLSERLRYLSIADSPYGKKGNEKK